MQYLGQVVYLVQVCPIQYFRQIFYLVYVCPMLSLGHTYTKEQIFVVYLLFI